MGRIIRVIIQNNINNLFLNNNYGNNSKEEVSNREIRYLPDLSIVNLLSVFVLVQRILLTILLIFYILGKSKHLCFYCGCILMLSDMVYPSKNNFCEENLERCGIWRRIDITFLDIKLRNINVTFSLLA